VPLSRDTIVYSPNFVTARTAADEEYRLSGNGAVLMVHSHLRAAQILARTAILNQPIPAYSCDDLKYRRAIYLGEVAPCVPPAAEVSQPVTVSAAVDQAVTKNT